ncbi:MAG: hypothetical protein PHX61_05360 [Alphaproteobacteria bacterium]|nr:hypothetical protein [Alphaproteobacteria bacterium]
MKKIFWFIFLFLLCFVLLVVGIDFITNPNTWTNSRHTVYEKTCVDFKSNNYNCSVGFMFTRTTYLVLLERQSIVRYMHGGMPPRRIDNCEVFDSRNWYCETGGTGKQALLMVDGKITDIGAKRDGYTQVDGQIPHIEYLTRSLFHDEDEAFDNYLASRGLGSKAKHP